MKAVGYPETTFAYYSGDCDRIRRLLKRYTTSFRRLIQQRFVYVVGTAGKDRAK